MIRVVRGVGRVAVALVGPPTRPLQRAVRRLLNPLTPAEVCVRLGHVADRADAARCARCHVLVVVVSPTPPTTPSGVSSATVTRPRPTDDAELELLLLLALLEVRVGLHRLRVERRRRELDARARRLRRLAATLDANPTFLEYGPVPRRVTPWEPYP